MKLNMGFSGDPNGAASIKNGIASDLSSIPVDDRANLAVVTQADMICWPSQHADLQTEA